MRARSTAITRLGVNVVGIPLDAGGMRMDALEKALADLKRRGVRPKFIYTIPTVQNPTGTILDDGRRQRYCSSSPRTMACRSSRTTVMRT